MNYKRIHDLIISRGKVRALMGHTERHHIIPLCMGGSDSEDNLVTLTTREHFIIHVLLCKIYPAVGSLYYAYNMMSITRSIKSRKYAKLRAEHNRLERLRTNSEYQRNKVRESNKLRVQSLSCRSKISDALKKYSGNRNSMYGKSWIHNKELKLNKPVPKSELEYYLKKGWSTGRIIKWV